MPNTKAAIKRLKQNKKKHARNKPAVSEIRTYAKKAKSAISEKNAAEADDVLKILESRLTKASKKNIIKKRTASRRISRLRRQWAKIESKS